MEGNESGKNMPCKESAFIPVELARNHIKKVNFFQNMSL
jgi:hypothetical protein